VDFFHGFHGKKTQPELPLSPGNVVNTELPGEAARAEAECAACGGEWLEAQLRMWRDKGVILFGLPSGKLT